MAHGVEKAGTDLGVVMGGDVWAVARCRLAALQALLSFSERNAVLQDRVRTGVSNISHSGRAFWVVGGAYGDLRHLLLTSLLGCPESLSGGRV